MAYTFRYRYVDYSTVFTGDPQSRGAESGEDAPGTLFANELAVDVGGTCWSPNETLSILDHHSAHEGQFPSTAAAVLHKAGLIQEKFTSQQGGVVWLVTHKNPDFDAFCSMYLARWVIEHPETVGWHELGLHPDGWVDLADRRKIDWFNLDTSHVRPEHRWLMLLAGYASRLDSRRPILCPPERALHSIVYAATKRGRNYLDPASGAVEFFDHVRTVLQDKQLNPVFDSVLEGSAEFAPEFAMLDREVKAYERDQQRARKAIVYLPEAEAPTPDFFKGTRDTTLLQQPPVSEIDSEHLLLADTFRIPTDGIYLRDPECLLFREWAWLDLEKSSLGAGFEFTAIAHSKVRANAPVNTTDYIFSIDPERAKGRHLYTVWSRLQTTEVDALRTHKEQALALAASQSNSTADKRAGTLGVLLADPWSDGQKYLGTLIDTPHRGTLIGSPGVRSDLRDDPVVEAVRTELESPVYSAESLVAGPQVTVVDYSGDASHQDLAPRQFDLNTPSQISPVIDRYFRFGSIRLRADVPLAPASRTQRGVGTQIGEALWQVLYPETPGALPDDFLERHLLVTADNVAVWGDRGIVVAQKHSAGAVPNARADHRNLDLRGDFARIVSLTRDIDTATTAGKNSPTGSKSKGADRAHLEKTLEKSEDLLRRAAELKYGLTLPDREPLRRFYDSIGMDRLLDTLRDLNASVAERLRREQAEQQDRKMEAVSQGGAKVLRKMGWLGVFISGYFSILVLQFITRTFLLQPATGHLMILVGALASLLLAAVILQPWRPRPQPKEALPEGPSWILILAIAAFVLAWLAELVSLLSH